MPYAVTPQGRVSFALFVLREHLFVFIRLIHVLFCFFFLLFFVRDVP